MALEIEFGFDELQITDFDAGMLLYGTAYLQSAGDGDFIVQSIELDGGLWLHNVREGQTLQALIYRAIAATLYDESTPYGAKAAEAWGEAFNEYHQPIDDDYQYQAWKDNQLDADFMEAAQ